MDLRQLRHFLVVAEELHFGRAAARLGIAQPALSQSIKRLEADVGVALFNRSSRRVELSAAGRTFLPDVRGAITQLDDGAHQAQRVERGEIAELDIGFTSAALFHTLPALMRRAREALPTLQVRLIERSSSDQIEALRAGTLDLAIVHPVARMLDGLHSITVERSRNMIAIPASWPLAAKPSVRLIELADCPFIMPPLHHGTRSVVALLAACEAAGFSPRVEQEAFQLITMLSLSAAGFGVCFVPETARRMGMNGVRILTIDDLPAGTELQLTAAWVPENLSPALRAVVAALEDLLPALR